MVKILCSFIGVLAISILIGLALKVDGTMIAFGTFLALLIFSKFIIAMMHEKEWKKKKIKIVMGQPWKIIAIYPAWLIFIASLLMGVGSYLPGNWTSNFICFMSNVVLALIVGSMVWASRPKVEIVEKPKGIF